MDLADLIARFTPAEGINPTSIPRLELVRFCQPTGPVHAMHEQAVVIVAQGTKEVLLGHQSYVNGPDKFLVVSVHVPIIGRVVEASPSRPYLCLRLHINVELLSRLVRDHPNDDRDASYAPSGMSLGQVTPELHSAATRLVALLEAPSDIRALASLVEEELLYRLLQSQGDRMRQIARSDSTVARVGRAIEYIKKHYAQMLRAEELAKQATMSPSSFQRHFRTLTSCSPLQYQKLIRLQEARSLIVARGLDAAAAAFEVGYASPSQFGREYKRLFGTPPVKDLRSRMATTQSA